MSRQKSFILCDLGPTTIEVTHTDEDFTFYQANVHHDHTTTSHRLKVEVFNDDILLEKWVRKTICSRRNGKGIVIDSVHIVCTGFTTADGGLTNFEARIGDEPIKQYTIANIVLEEPYGLIHSIVCDPGTTKPARRDAIAALLSIFGKDVPKDCVIDYITIYPNGESQAFYKGYIHYKA